MNNGIPESNLQRIECEECENLRRKYEACFINWYDTEFVKGNAKEVGCKEYFDPYKKCVMECLTKLHPDGELGEFIRNPDLQYTDEFGAAKPAEEQ